MKQVLFKQLGPCAVPVRQTAGAAGYDICSAEAPYTLEVGARHTFNTNLAMAVPSGYVCDVRSRSGLAHKHGLCVLNAPGTIDSDYRGEVGVILQNNGDTPYTVLPGYRIAQLVFLKCEEPSVKVVNELPPTQSERNGGFGHTGDC